MDFDPQSGREQSGLRTSVVLSRRKYNRVSGLAVVCPITRRAKGFASEVVVLPEAGIEGVILADHVKSIDWTNRGQRVSGSVSEVTLSLIADRIENLIR